MYPYGFIKLYHSLYGREFINKIRAYSNISQSPLDEWTLMTEWNLNCKPHLNGFSYNYIFNASERDRTT